MFRNLSMRAKLLIPILGILAVALPLLVLFIYLQVGKVTEDFAYEQSRKIAEEIGGRVDSRLEAAVQTAKTLASVLSTLATSPERDRKLAVSLARGVIGSSEDYLAITAGWELGGFDGGGADPAS